MSFITAALIGGGAAIIGGGIAASGARKAAGMQVGAADRAAQLQKEQFNRQVELQEPFRMAGCSGVARTGSSV